MWFGLCVCVQEPLLFSLIHTALTPALLCLTFHPGLFIRGITETEVMACIRCDAGVGMYVLLCSKTFPDGSL